MAASRLLWVQSRAPCARSLGSRLAPLSAPLRRPLAGKLFWPENFPEPFLLPLLPGRADRPGPGEIEHNTKTIQDLNPPNANHGGLTVLEPPDRVLGR